MEEPRVAIVRSHRPASANASARAVTARPVPLRKGMTVEAAFRATVLECLAQVGGNAPAVRARDPKGVHQIRVGLRRLQVALSSFGGVDQRAEIEVLSRRGRTIADAFGPARDLDVLAQALVPPVQAQYPRNASFAALEAALANARDAAWDDALAQVLNPDFASFLNDVAALAESMPQDDSPVAKASKKALKHHLKRAKKRGRALSESYDWRTHKLRIALKKLRYAAEFFAPLYPHKKSRGYIGRLKKLLDRLGEANDVHGIEHALARLGDAPELRFAIGTVAGWHGAREPDLMHDAMKAWRSFRKKTAFWS